ncbi:MAG: ATP-binding cassette domain-containing protein, partial [Collinsella sp.]|nr:ATP-binding cassette domain-containing protein [Collinsella sp.]
MNPFIEIDHVSFSYGSSSQRVLDDVELTVMSGEFVGIIGPSGAGKSTLAGLVSGAIPHHHRGVLEGAVRLEGTDTRSLDLTGIAQIVGSVGQDIDAQMVASVVEDELLYGLE